MTIDSTKEIIINIVNVVKSFQPDSNFINFHILRLITSKEMKWNKGISYYVITYLN